MSLQRFLSEEAGVQRVDISKADSDGSRTRTHSLIPLQPCCTAHFLQKGKEARISHMENKTPGTAGPSPHT